MGIFQLTTLAPESRDHSIGYGDPAKIDAQIGLIKKYVAAPEDKLVKAADIYTNDYIGHVTMTADEWAQVKKNNASIAAIMGQT